MSRSGDSSLPRMDDNYAGNHGYQPVSELMRAIILRTIEDFNSGGEFKEEALSYMFDQDEEYVFSFFSICDHFGIDAPKTRSSIINATHRISTRRRTPI